MGWYVVEFPIDEAVGEAAAEALGRAGADGVAEEWRQGQRYVRGFWKDAEEARVAAATAEALARLVEFGLLERVPEVAFTTMEDRTGWRGGSSTSRRWRSPRGWRWCPGGKRIARAPGRRW